jgi:SHS2 domain-containing protein
MMPKGYEYFEHPSDIRIQCTGITVNELFENAAKAIYDLMIEKTATGEEVEKQIDLKADSLQDLFFEWVSEVIFYAHAYKIFFYKFYYLKLTEKQLLVNAFGVKVSKDIKLKGEVKAITYHDFYIKKQENYWLANFIVDV